MSLQDEMTSQMLQAPLAHGDSNEIDLEFLGNLHSLLARWIKGKRSRDPFTFSGTDGALFLGQPFTGDLGPRDFSDPMQSFIAGIGRA